MAMWRCPHCGTPQTEAARCWVCHRSSTTCSTCQHFRRSLAASVGFCGLDRRRAPLGGTEHRGCWEPATAAATREEPAPPDVALDPVVARLRPERSVRPGILQGFVPIELAERGPLALQPADPARLPRPAMIETPEPWADRETLFGDV